MPPSPPTAPADDSYSNPEREVTVNEDAGGKGARASPNRERDLLGFDESKYLFYVQDLVSKSLLIAAV